MTVRSDDELEAVVKRCRIVIVFFSGRNCSICQSFERMFKFICKGYRSLCCIKALADDVMRHVRDLGVLCVPSLAAYVNGRLAARTAGYLYAPVVNLFITTVLRKAAEVHGEAGAAT